MAEGGDLKIPGAGIGIGTVIPGPYNCLRVKRILFIFVLWFCSPRANAATIDIQDVNHVLSDVQKERARKIVDRMLVFHETHLKLQGELIVPVRLVPEEEFEQARKQVAPGIHTDSGFYSERKNEIFINRDKKYFGTLIHEVQHFVLRSGFQKPPKWLNEGLSEYFENSYISKNGEICIKEQNGKRARVCKWIESENHILPGLFKLTKDDWANNNASTEFRPSSLSWSLIYFLMSTPERRTKLDGIMMDMQDAKLNLDSVFEKYFAGGIEGLEKDWREFYSNRQGYPSFQKL